MADFPPGALRAFCTFLTLALPAGAQCQLSWLAGANTAGPNGAVNALAELNNGDVIAAGSFQVADDAVCAGIARWDGNEWHALGAGVNGFVTAAAVMPNGDLIVSGGFSEAGGSYTGRIARWDGNSWSSIGADVPGTVVDLAVAPNGDLIAGGSFASIGGQPADGIARYNGTSWAGIGATTGLLGVAAITFLANGDLIIGGSAPVGSPDVVRWTGTAWVALMPGVASNAIVNLRDLAALPNGDVAIAASIVNPGGSLAIWNGATLVAGGAPLADVLNVEVASNGDLLAGGNAGGTGNTAARFDGTSWTGLGSSSTNSLALLETSGGALVSAGYVTPSPMPGVGAVSQRIGSAWTLLGGPATPAFTVNALQRLPNGDLVAGGAFDTIAGVAANNIARFDGSSWQPLGLGVDGPVTSLELGPTGALLVGGAFQQAGGAPALRIASYQAATWSPLAGGLPFPPKAMAQTQNGRVAAVLDAPVANTIYTFQGGNWNQLGGLILGQAVDVVALPSNEFLLLGSFVVGGALRFSGVLIDVVPGTVGLSVLAADVDRDGELLFVTSQLAMPGVTDIARLVNGTMTTVLAGPPATSISDIAVLPDGDLVVSAGQSSVFGALAGAIQRWDGGSWQIVDGGLGFGSVRAIAVRDQGELFACGSFLSAGSHTSIGFARAQTSCPASTAALGVGCTGGAGAVTLVANNLPWLDTTFTSTANGMAPLSLALHAVGVSPTTVALPFGASGCSLLVAPVFTALLFPGNGTVEAPLAIPNVASLAGQVITTQVIGIELAPSLALIRTTSSNALQLTIGAL